MRILVANIALTLNSNPLLCELYRKYSTKFIASADLSKCDYGEHSVLYKPRTDSNIREENIERRYI